YRLLETDYGYRRREVQTDYLFASSDEAIESTEFFFGKELSHRIIENQWTRVPEWTGLWYKSAHAT
ncbi:MAG: hypothetical protein R3335_11535, partial [Anaerolineales bacterium]|nr:hypothetical protein [Anaerolineales bacterium]